MKALAISLMNLKRMLRDRSAIFFVFIFPVALILLIGAQFGGASVPQLGYVSAGTGPLSAGLLERLQGDVELVQYPTEADLVTAVERNMVNAGIVVPTDYESAIDSSDPIEVVFIAPPSGAPLRLVVAAAVDDQAAILEAALFAAERLDLPTEQTFAAASSSEQVGLTVSTESVGESLFPATLGRFDLGASSQLILFMFVNGLAGSAALIQSRRLRVSQRMLGTPTSMTSVVIGEAGGRFAVSIFQGIYIVVATLLMFQVNWGDPLGALAVIVLFGLVSAGAATLMGATFRNDQQAGGIGVVLGLGLAALGGCMFPIELFSPAMQRLAHITPHAWALDAIAELVRRDGTVVDILPQLGVLAAFAAVFLGLATWRLRAVLTKA